MLFLEDFQGVVIVNRLSGIQHTEDSDYYYLHVNGGENWHQLVEWSLLQGINGLKISHSFPAVPAQRRFKILERMA